MDIKYKGKMNGWIYYNNGRKMHNMPLHRKLNEKKRYHTRCEVEETIDAFLIYCKNAE